MSDLLVNEVPCIDDDSFKKALDAVTSNKLINYAMIVTGYSLQQDHYTKNLLFDKISRERLTIATVNIEIQQIFDLPTKIMFYVKLPPLMDGINEKPQEPYMVEVVDINGKRIPKFKKDVNLNRPIVDQLNEFTEQAYLYLKLYCCQEV